MVAKNMKQLNDMLMKELRKAASVASEKMLADMYEETGDFYTKKDPKMYERTGALGDSPRTTSLTVKKSNVGGEVSFKAYLDTSESYTTGKKPSMADVLRLANSGISPTAPNHLRNTVGRQGFWDRAKIKMEDTFSQTMRDFFK